MRSGVDMDDMNLERIDSSDAEIIPPNSKLNNYSKDYAEDAVYENVEENNNTSSGNAYSQESYSTNDYSGNGYSTAGGNEYYSGYSNSDDQIALTLAVISLICGIISIVCCCLSCISGLLSITAIVCGIVSINKSDKYKGLAICGIVCGSSGLVLRIFTAIASGFASAIDNVRDKVLNSIDIEDFF